MKLMNFTKTVLKNLISGPVTRNYPAEPKQFFERTRGHVDIAIDTCVFCGLCSKKCPTGAISVSREARTWEISRFDCIQCGYCVESCPKRCLSMAGQYPLPDGRKPTDCYSAPAPEPAAQQMAAGQTKE